MNSLAAMFINSHLRNIGTSVFLIHRESKGDYDEFLRLLKEDKAFSKPMIEGIKKLEKDLLAISKEKEKKMAEKERVNIFKEKNIKLS